MSSTLREVPEDAYAQARRALDKAAGAPVWGLYGAPLKAAVDAAARPIQNAVLREFATAGQGCGALVAALLTLSIEFVLYVSIILFTGGWLRWLAAAALALNVAVQVCARLWNRRARRIARAELLSDLKRSALL